MDTTVAGQVLDVARRHGADTVFGLPGVHNLAFWNAGTAPVVVRHEQTAVYAADGWARTTGRLGAAVVTTGPGAANAVAAFGEAAAAHSPVLLVASEIPQALHRDGRVRGVLHESRDQAALFTPLAKAVFTPRTPAEVAAVIGEGAATALAHPRGPVYLDVPADVLGQPAGPLPPVPDPPVAAVTGLDDAAAVLAGTRVVLWAGGDAADHADAVAALASHLGAPVVTSFRGRGVPPTAHATALGLPPHEPEPAALIASADVLLVVGGDLDGMNTRNWTMPRPPRLVVVDAAAPVDPPEWAADATVTGPLDAALPGLTSRVPAATAWAPTGMRAAVLDRLRTDPATAEALALLDAVDHARTPDTVLVCDMAVAGYWVGGYAPAPAPRRLAYPVGWGTLGFGLPAALGAAAAGHPVIAVCGDGGLMMALGELATLVQERLPVTVLVVDDGGYGMLRYDQQRAGHPERGVDLVTPDFPALAAAFGLPATAVASVAELREPLAAAVATGGPHLLRVPAVLTPPRTTSPRWAE
ncbi:thiamine pyrophosphate-binding protein [Pseudonocardia abyssalis]|uniref:Thiamine pyrophosphate-binding protein n=1 Tax=Pseudonocardia abyssalis TaxID=2792008 RepID=A0ABS6UL46_9PSEU|nr:thiamine pyrophosphate-dependent enzyme [Pseudonocardia abyssalis]MBW0114630.1 thiamine pyrophosphate-binding protein [Pseudonocardia abyssalis]MBW0132980.1 thiamine pyrophosphate-binding protein [Pseudonocardia abyssalis]